MDSNSVIIEELLDNILVEPEIDAGSDELVDLIEELLNNPVDLNSADFIELLKIPYLDSQSAQMIIEQRNKFGNFFSPNELFAIKNLDKVITEKILPIVKASISFRDVDQIENEGNYTKSILNNSKLKFRSRFSNDLQNRSGFYKNRYEGSKLKSYNRLLYNFDKNYQAGFLIEKDPGESSYSDFSSFHLQVKDMGFVKSFIAGDYVLEFGQGLALWSPYGFSKGADAIFPVKKRSRYLRPYVSATEYRFYRGASFRLSFDDFNLSAFYSNKSIDANIDSITGKINSIGETGFHRTETEISKKNAAQEKLIGAVIDYKFIGQYNFGLIYYNASFDKDITSASQYGISGKNFNYLSFYYDFNLSRINLFGEVSYDGNSVASINGLQFLVSHDFIFTTSVRSYPRNYKNLYGYGFSERSGSINNEIGFYSGLKWKLPIGILNFYYDIFKFPYRTRANSTSSEGNELLVDFISQPLPNFEFRARYKNENKEVSEIINVDEKIVRRLKQIARTDFIYNVTKDLRLKTRFEYNYFFIKDAGAKENGFLVYQDVRYVPISKINIYGRVIFFETDSFNSAIYEYENDLMGVMPNLAMYGQGIRWYVILKYKPLRMLTLSAKYSETYKPNETSLSSGDNEIIGNIDNRISLQIDMSF